MTNLRQAGAQLELRLDRCHWAALETLRKSGPVQVLDMDRERTRLENIELQNATDDELTGLALLLNTGTLYGAGFRLRTRVWAERDRRKANG